MWWTEKEASCGWLTVDSRWRRWCRVSTVPAAASACFCALMYSMWAWCHVDVQHNRGRDENEKIRQVGGATGSGSAFRNMLRRSELHPKFADFVLSITYIHKLNRPDCTGIFWCWSWSLDLNGWMERLSRVRQQKEDSYLHPRQLDYKRSPETRNKRQQKIWKMP